MGKAIEKIQNKMLKIKFGNLYAKLDLAKQFWACIFRRFETDVSERLVFIWHIDRITIIIKLMYVLHTHTLIWQLFTTKTQETLHPHVLIHGSGTRAERIYCEQTNSCIGFGILNSKLAI